MNRVDLREFLSAYLAEVDEQLHTANGKLLEVDASLRGGESNPRAVRDLFRALHTIKGLSAMVNVDAAVTIAHRLESVVRAADRSGGHLPLAAIDTILHGVHAIEHRVRELAAGKPVSAVPAELLATLDALDTSADSAPADPPATLDLDPTILAKLAPFEVDALAKGGRDGRRAVRVDFSPSPRKAEQGLSINSVRERLGVFAEIVKVVPISVRPTEDAPGALTFALLLLTASSDEDVAGAVGVEPGAVRTIATQAPRVPLPPLVNDEEDDSDGPGRRGVVRVEIVRLDEAMEHLSTLIVTRSRLARVVAKLAEQGISTRELQEIIRDNTRQLRDLRSSILRMRMVPVTEVLDRLPLLVRGLQRKNEKAVRLAMDAGNAELDKGVAERLFPALVHLVRNAVDHAIEAAAVRTTRGKPEEGTLRITCHSSNTRLELAVQDDGGGIDRAAVERRSGRELPPGEDALLDAICTPGFSTLDRATTTSGRGMGMDIVRRIIVDQLGGELVLETKPGIGTTFRIRVPLTISIVDSFTLDCRKSRYVVPVSMVEEIVEVDRAAVRRGPIRSASAAVVSALIERRGEAVPLIELGDALDLPRAAAPSPLALVVRRAGAAFAFGLDRVLGQQETVVRPLVDPLVQVPGFSGSTDLGDGKPTLVLDLLSLGATLLDRGRHAA